LFAAPSQAVLVAYDIYRFTNSPAVGFGDRYGEGVDGKNYDHRQV
jgi:hypothetical protein